MEEKKNKTYETRELSLAATLMTVGFELTGINYQVEGQNNRPIGYFLFENNRELGEAVQKFWAGKLAVEPRTFMQNLRGLRSQTNSKYKSPNSEFSKMS